MNRFHPFIFVLCLVLLCSLTSFSQIQETPTETPTVIPTVTPTFVPTIKPSPTPYVNVAPIVSYPNIRDVTVYKGHPKTIRINIADENNEQLSIECLNPEFGKFSEIRTIPGWLSTHWKIKSSIMPFGETIITFRITDNGTPKLSTDYSASIHVYEYKSDDVIVAQGYGGTTNLFRNKAIETTNPDSDGFQNTTLSYLTVASWNAMSAVFEANVGGGTDRETHIATGDIDNDGNDEIITTFGPVTKPAKPNSANMMIVYDGDGNVKIPPFGCFFPTEKPGETVNNPNGEMRAAIGNFIGSSTNNQIALAQGFGGNSVVRIFQYNGGTSVENPGANWDVVAQLYGTDIPELGIHSTFALSDEFRDARTNNANGGVTLAAGDLDRDGIDELVVGQTGSPSSRGIIQVLDLGKPNQKVNNIIFDASYTEFIPGPAANSMGDLGGFNISIADLDADGSLEIILTCQGSSFFRIQAYHTVIDNFHITGIRAINTNKWKIMKRTHILQTSGLSIGTGEFSGKKDDGDEFIIGTQALVEYSDFNASVKRKPEYSAYMIFKSNLLNIYPFKILLDMPLPFGYYTRTIDIGIPAFVGAYEPLSHSVNVAGFHSAN